MNDNKQILKYCPNFYKIINFNPISGDELSEKIIKIYQEYIPLRISWLIWSADFFVKKVVKKVQKNLEVKKKVVPLQSQTKNGVQQTSSLARKVHWKDCFTVQEASTEKIQFIEKRWFFWKNWECQWQAKNYIKIYNEEFDPGSGWTLAAGLTHASRGAACSNFRVWMTATGARVRNAWATCPFQGDNRWKRRLIPHGINFRHLWLIKEFRKRIGSRDIS